jgi:hypothetical protein
VTRRRALLPPTEASSDGARRLRELLRKQSFGAIARRLRCDESAVRFYASEARKPNLVMRARIREVLEIPESSWDEAPVADPYATSEPPTRRPA